MARRRVWIASPYFVPSDEVSAALQLAAVRGVDVRVMIPARPDHLLVYLAGFTYGPDKNGAPLRIFRYEKGFLHNKVLLVDDEVAAVGSANLDNRSFRLNFEIMVLAKGAVVVGASVVDEKAQQPVGNPMATVQVPSWGTDKPAGKSGIFARLEW